jgi:hypothetical protein
MKLKFETLSVENTKRIDKDNLMLEMSEAIVGAMGTFIAISKGILNTDGGLNEIAKEQAEILREIYEKYTTQKK